MTRDEWIVKHVPAVKAAARAFCRRCPWLRPETVDDFEADALCRLTLQAQQLADRGELSDESKNTATYVSTISRHSCLDSLTRLKRAENISQQLKLSELLTFCEDSTVFNGYKTDYKDRGSDIPLSEDMSPTELAALEAYIDREPKSAWQREKLKRRVLFVLRKFGVVHDDDRIFQYTSRAPQGSRLLNRREQAGNS